jgi:PAS domain S-box-containing protein
MNDADLANGGPRRPSSEAALPFWPIFEQSIIPIALIDEERRFVAVNDALVRYYEYPRERLLGTRGEGMIPEDPGIEERWEKLLREGQMYGEREVQHADGRRLQVSFASHVTIDAGRRLVIVVALAVRLADGAELITPTPTDGLGEVSPALTPREAEVVRLVALGSNTRTIATQLGLSPETVRTHVRNAMVKTDSHTRAQLVAQVLADGLASDGGTEEPPQPLPAQGG